MKRATVRAALAALGFLAAGVAAAQEITLQPGEPPRPRPHGFRVDGAWPDFGIVDLVQGDVGFLVGANVGLGTIFAPWIDFTGGVRYWKADIDRTSLADTSRGRVTNLSVHPDLRLHLFRWGWARPYVMSGVSVQFVDADIPDDASLQDALSGFRMGLDTGFGISSAGGKVRWHLEGRREFVEDVGNWTWALGAGWWPDVRAQREPRAMVSAAPPAWQTATPPATTPESPVEPLVRDLIEENRTMRAEMDSLRRAMDDRRAQAATPASPEPPPPAPPPAPEPPALGVQLERMAALSTMSHLAPTDEGWRLVLGGELAFESGSAKLTPAAREEIRRLADVLLRHPKARLIVEGHSDSSGDAMQNLVLSEERGSVVRNELILLGIDPASIRARGLGSGVPIADNSAPEGRARNRRVEIRVVDPARAGGGTAPR